jgi:hypothetical protein
MFSARVAYAPPFVILVNPGKKPWTKAYALPEAAATTF